MPDPDRLLNTLRRAARAFRTTPGRSGRLLRPEGAAEILVAGDLHGHVENFRQILDRAELASRPTRHLVVQELVHGPFRYPGGGDKSHQLLDLVAALKCQYPERVHVLLGNHEAAQWTGEWIEKDGVDSNAAFRLGVKEAYGNRAPEVEDAYRELFAAWALGMRTPNRVWLSHSVPGGKHLDRFERRALEAEWDGPAELQAGGWAHAMLWGRDTRAETVARFLCAVDADLAITGHIPCPEGFGTPNERQVILDCMGTPACCCLFPTDRRLTQAELVARIITL